MASRIAGITIEIGGDTTKLQSALRDVDKSLKGTQSVLKDVNKLLKLDPANTELLTQKQKALKSAIAQTKDRLQQLRDAQSGVAEGTAEWDSLQREIISTEQDLKGLEKQLRAFGSVASQQIKAAGKAMQDFGQKVSAAGDKLMPLSTAAAGALTALGGMAYKTVQAADDLNTLAQQTGFTTEEIQKIKYASDLVDVSFDDMAGAMKKLKPKITDNNEELQSLGVSVQNADGSLRSANDVFFDAVTALGQVENETERDQIAMKLFGKSADQLAGIIDDGGAALKAYGKEAEELGVIMDGDTIDALNDVNDTIDKLKATSKGSLAQLGATLAKTLAPALDKVVSVIDKVTAALKKLTPEQTEMILKVVGIVAAIGPALKILGTLVSSIGGVVSAIGTIVGVLGGPLTLAIGAIIAVGVLLWKNWDTVKEKATQLKDWLAATWTNIKTTVSTTVEGLRANVTNAWNNIRNGVVNAVSGLKNSVVSIWDSMRASINGVIDGIRGKIDTFKNKFNELKTTVQNAVANIKNAFNFSWSLPHIKLPHFRVSGGKWPYGLGGEGYLPSISVSWYKKAYDNPVMFNSPTVLQTPSGYKGFGDGAGAEIVMGLNKLRELVGTSGDTTINVYAAPGMNVNELADAVQQRLVALNRQREAAYA